MINRDDLLAWIHKLHHVYAANKAYLTDLDAAIGDADHGINMDRGFGAVAAELDQNAPGDNGTLLKAVAMTLIKTVGALPVLCTARFSCARRPPAKAKTILRRGTSSRFLTRAFRGLCKEAKPN